MALLLIIIAPNGHILANIAMVSQFPLAIDLSSKGLPGQLQVRLLLGCGVMGSGLRRPAPRSRSRAKPFRVCGYCERTGRSRDRAAASPAKYRDAARIAAA